MRTMLLLLAAMMSSSPVPNGWEESSAGRDAQLKIVRGDAIAAVEQALGAPTIDRRLQSTQDDGAVRSLEYAFADKRVRFDAAPPLAAGDDLVIAVDAAGRIVDLRYEPNRFNFDGPRTLLASRNVVRAVEIVPGRGAWVRAGAN